MILGMGLVLAFMVLPDMLGNRGSAHVQRVSAERLDGKRVEAAANTEVERRAAETEATPVARPPPGSFRILGGERETAGGGSSGSSAKSSGADRSHAGESSEVHGSTLRIWHGADRRTWAPPFRLRRQGAPGTS